MKRLAAAIVIVAVIAIVALAFLPSGDGRILLHPTPSPSSAVEGFWCWNPDAIPDPHPSPYAKESGMDHPCTADEMVPLNVTAPVPQTTKP